PDAPGLRASRRALPSLERGVVEAPAVRRLGLRRLQAPLPQRRREGPPAAHLQSPDPVAKKEAASDGVRLPAPNPLGALLPDGPRTRRRRPRNGRVRSHLLRAARP